MKKNHSNPVPPEIQAEIDILASSQAPIRTDLIPEATGDWSQAQRGLFYRPVLERLESADLAYEVSQDDAKTFAPILLPTSDDELLPEDS
jgi:hypothetical protein